jgi:inner membrane protein
VISLATPLSHLAVPLALAVALGPDIVSPALMAWALACAALPDIDALGLWLGIPYDHPFGHRGFTHSLAFCMVLAGVGSLFAPALGTVPSTAFWVLLASGASHGVLDALTNGGLGIAFFSPFSQRRYFLPWRVIKVSPLHPAELFSRQGLRVLGSEIHWVWGPCVGVALAAWMLRNP